MPVLAKWVDESRAVFPDPVLQDSPVHVFAPSELVARQSTSLLPEAENGAHLGWSMGPYWGTLV